MVEIFNAKTGVRLAKVPFGGGSGSAPFGLTAPNIGGDPITYRISDDTNQEVGASALATLSSEGGGGGSAGGDDGCCGVYEGTSAIPPTKKPPEPGNDNCNDQAGQGSTEDTVSNAADDAADGTPKVPDSPEPENPLVEAMPDENIGNEPPPAGPGLFDSMLADIQETKGGANVSINLGKFTPPLTFSSRHLDSLNLSSPDFRKFFLSEALSKTGTTITQGAGDFNVYTRHNGKYVVRAGEDGFRSAVTTEYISNLVQIPSSNRWELQITKVGDRFGIDPTVAVLQADQIVSSSGRVDILYSLSGGGFAWGQPSIIWRFTSMTDADGHTVLEVRKLGQGSRADEGEPTYVRYWQKEDNEGATHTFMHAPGSAVMTEVVDRDEAHPNGNIVVRGRITHRGTGADATREGWISRTGFGYTDKPVLGDDDDPNVALLNFGGSGNTLWKWSTNGMWEKVSVTPSLDAVVRRVETLRPWGDAVTPEGADSGNAHCTIDEINGLAVGDVHTKVISMAGVEVSRTVDAKSVAASLGGNLVQITDTHVQYPNGPQNAPVVTYTQQFASQMLDPGAGRINFQRNADGSTETTTYQAGLLSIPTANDPIPTAEWTFTAMDPMDLTQILSDYDARRVQRDREFADGRKVRAVDWEDDERRVRVTHRYVMLNDLPIFIESVRFTYRGQDRVKIEWTRKQNPTAGDWVKEYEVSGTMHDPNVATTYDVTGVGTSHAFPTFYLANPTTITREAIAAGGGAVAVPEQVTEFGYDSAYRVTSEKVKQGSDVLQQIDFKYNTAGQLESKTINNAVVTEYRYEDYGLGGTKTREYRRALLAPRPGTLVSETITDWRGVLVSRSGPGVVEEQRTESSAGVSRIETATHFGPAGSPVVSDFAQKDGIGRKTGEKISVPDGVWRNWIYDEKNRPLQELHGFFPVRTWSYDQYGMVAETLNPAYDPMRKLQSQVAYVEADGAVWESSQSGYFDWLTNEWDVEETQTKVTGLNTAAGEHSVRRFRRRGGDWTVVTETVDKTNKMIVETTTRPNVVSPEVRKFRGGLLVWEQAHNQIDPTIYTYDALDRVVAISEKGGALAISADYDDVFGNISLVATTGSDGTYTERRNTYYQPNEETPGKIKTRVEDGRTIYYKWTTRGELQATWGATHPVKYDYDAAGRLWKMHTYQNDPGTNPALWPIGNVTEWVYYPGTMALQTKKDAANRGAVYEYDSLGRVSKRTWARKQAGDVPLFTEYSHNFLGELTGMTYNDNGATPNVTITRDRMGRVVGVADGAGGWSFGYDAKGRFEREINNTTNSGIIYTYDPADRPAGYSYWKQTQETGSWETWGGWGYDPLTGRLNGFSTAEGWMDQFYHPGSDRPSAVTLGGVQSTRGYDGLGRLKSTSTTAPGATALTRTYSHNANGQREIMTGEDGNYWKYSYDTVTLQQVSEADKKGNNSGTFYPNQTIPGYSFDYIYDTIGNRLETWHSGLSMVWQPSPLDQYAGPVRTHLPAVEVMGIADPAATVRINGNAASVRNGAFFWHQMTVNTPTASRGGWLGLTIREEKPAEPGEPAPPAVETTGKQFVLPINTFPVYDFDGNLTRDERWNYTWDAENRLIVQETRWQGATAVPGMPILRIEYKYDAYSRRVEKNVSTWSSSTNSFEPTKVTKFAYDGWNVIAEWEASAPNLSNVSLVRTHHWGLDLTDSLQDAGGVGGLILTRHHSPSGQTASYVPAIDGSGNVLALFDTVTGQRVAEYEYGPFGERLRATGPVASANPFRYSSKYEDAETGSVYFGYRYYSPLRGRWLSRDPIGEDDGPNLYSFVQNHPIDYLDNNGLRRVAPRSGWGGRSGTYEEAAHQRALYHEQMFHAARARQQNRRRTDRLTPRNAPNAPLPPSAPNPSPRPPSNPLPKWVSVPLPLVPPPVIPPADHPPLGPGDRPPSCRLVRANKREGPSASDAPSRGALMCPVPRPICYECVYWCSSMSFRQTTINRFQAGGCSRPTEPALIPGWDTEAACQAGIDKGEKMPYNYDSY